MTNEDLERLIKVLDGTQFEIENRADGYVWVSLKDPWEGVEFCKSKLNDFIYLVSDFKNIDQMKQRFIPSTEEAYVNQLKAEAFELYGEIKDGDRFEEPCGEIYIFETDDNAKWDYINNSNDSDTLCHHALEIYKQGQWAKKMPKRIEVDFGWRIDNILGINQVVFAFIDKSKYDQDPRKVESVLQGMGDIEIKHTFDFLAKQLEEYLNK